MPSYFPPKKNTEFIFYVSLTSQASRPQFQANPTLAAGDVTVSTDGGAFGNLTTLPAVTPASGHAVKVTVSATEMNGDNILVLFEDQAGDEWDDLVISIQTTARLLDDIDTDVAAILVDTNELQTDWVDGGRLDLILDARASQTTADAIETDTQDIQTRLPAALVSGKMDADATAISGSTEAADNLEASSETIVVGAATATTLSTTQMSTDLTEATDDHYNGRIIIWTSGVLQDQATDVTDYDGASKTFTFTATTEAPSNGDTFTIV